MRAEVSRPGVRNLVGVIWTLVMVPQLSGVTPAQFTMSASLASFAAGSEERDSFPPQIAV